MSHLSAQSGVVVCQLCDPLAWCSQSLTQHGESLVMCPYMTCSDTHPNWVGDKYVSAIMFYDHSNVSAMRVCHFTGVVPFRLRCVSRMGRYTYYAVGVSFCLQSAHTDFIYLTPEAVLHCKCCGPRIQHIRTCTYRHPVEVCVRGRHTCTCTCIRMGSHQTLTMLYESLDK